MEHWADAFYRNDEVLKALEQCDDSCVFEWMNRMLPITGSKVAWDRAPGTHSHWFCGEDEAKAEQVVSKVISILSDQGWVIHAGDGVSRFAVRFPAADLRPVVPSLLALPEHHYFLAEDESWFLAASFEGHIDLLRF